MKTLKIILSLCLFIFLCAGSCRTGGACEEPNNVNNSSIVVDFIESQTGRYLYSETDPLYNKDSLKVFTSAGNQIRLLFALKIIPNTFKSFYVVDIGPIYDFQTDANSFNTEICKDFIIKYTYYEIDTIKACFKAKSTTCGSVFESLKIFRKGVLIGSNNNTTHLLLTHYKK